MPAAALGMLEAPVQYGGAPCQRRPTRDVQLQWACSLRGMLTQVLGLGSDRITLRGCRQDRGMPADPERLKRLRVCQLQMGQAPGNADWARACGQVWLVGHNSPMRPRSSRSRLQGRGSASRQGLGILDIGQRGIQQACSMRGMPTQGLGLVWSHPSVHGSFSPAGHL